MGCGSAWRQRVALVGGICGRHLWVALVGGACGWRLWVAAVGRSTLCPSWLQNRLKEMHLELNRERQDEEFARKEELRFAQFKGLRMQAPSALRPPPSTLHPSPSTLHAALHCLHLRISFIC